MVNDGIFLECYYPDYCCEISEENDIILALDEKENHPKYAKRILERTAFAKNTRHIYYTMDDDGMLGAAYNYEPVVG